MLQTFHILRGSCRGQAADYPYTYFLFQACWRLPAYIFPIPGYAGYYPNTYFLFQIIMEITPIHISYSMLYWRLPLYILSIPGCWRLPQYIFSIPGHAGDYPYTYFLFQVMLEITPIPVRSVGKASSVLN